MLKVRTIAELRKSLAPARSAGRRIGLVATMGALHEGHLSLIRMARQECDPVVVTLFVNPSQFNDPGDLAAYPRDEDRDCALAAQAGADLLFAPAPEEIYPPGFATTVSVAGVTDPLEGRHRGRGHFDGVATVVTKLFNIVTPDVAYFGQKDAQQAQMIRRLVEDLNLPVQISLAPTVRDHDGLALSSRNARLSGADRSRATSLRRALAAAAAAVREGERDPEAARAAALTELQRAGVEPEYVELVDPQTFEAVQEIAGEVLAVVAATIGTTRLIDNEPIAVSVAVAEQPVGT